MVHRPYNPAISAAFDRVSSAAATLRKRARRERGTDSGSSRKGARVRAPIGVAPVPEPGLESRLVWIWGSPRSGSTWLLKLLSAPLDPDPELPLGFRAPEPADPPEPADSVPIDETFLSNHLAPAFAEPRIVDGRWVPGTINNLLATAKPAYALSDAYAHVWRPAARDLALARIQGVLDRAHDQGIALDPDHRVVIKETNGSHAADIVMSITPSARLLLLIRDGRDVVDSLLAGYQPGAFFANNQGESISTAGERERAIDWAARLWACNTDITLRAIEEHPPELCKVCRYEDLLADPAGRLAEIYEWMGLSRSATQIDAIVERHSFSRLPANQTGPLTRNRAARPGLWRENLSAAEQATVDGICGPLLERFDYER